jgi:hypothetical protein
VVRNPTAIYGLAAANDNNPGTFFVLGLPVNLDGTLTRKVLYQFKGTPDGANPTRLISGRKGGVFYGVTYGGGASGNGTVFEIVR